MWFLFVVFLILAVCAANYEKKTPLVTKTTTIKPGLIAILGGLAFLFLLGALASSDDDGKKVAPDKGGKTQELKTNEDFVRSLMESK